MLSDDALLTGLTDGADRAVAVFDARYRPILEAYARRVRIPPSEVGVYVSEVLGDEAIRLAQPSAPKPASVEAYLIRVLRNRYLNSRRSAERRRRNQEAAADDTTGEWVVTSLCSEESLRASAGPDAGSASVGRVLGQLAEELVARVSDEEYSILMWIGQGASHREIAGWVGSSYDATSKRIWRLCRRLRDHASRQAETLPDADRTEVERFIRRAAAPVLERVLTRAVPA